MSAYMEAAADPKVRRIDHRTILRPFHQPMPGQEQEWHAYCEDCPDWGFCGVEGLAAQAAYDHTGAHL